MSRKRWLFWGLLSGLLVMLVLGTLLLLLGIHVAYNSFIVPNPQIVTSGTAQGVPSSPVGFTFLALVVAFSVYLRQVASGADEKRDKILRGKVYLYPPNGPSTPEKLVALDKTHENLTVVAPFLIWLSLFVTARIFLEGLLPFRFEWLQRIVPYIRIVDCLLLEWLGLMFVVLGIFHLIASRRDEKLRKSARANQQ